MASVSAVRNGEDYGFVGLSSIFKLHSQFSDRGLGLAVYRRAMDLLGGGGGLLSWTLSRNNTGGLRQARFRSSAPHAYRVEGVVAIDGLPFLTRPVEQGDHKGAVVVEKLGRNNAEVVFDFDRGHVPAARTQ